MTEDAPGAEDPDVPVADVVAYTYGASSYGWCGWCRQWRSYGRLTGAVVRPSGCSKERNESCPTKANVPVMVWPVPLRRPLSLTAGDGRPGGTLPLSTEIRNTLPIAASMTSMLPVSPKGCVSLARFASAHGWRVRIETARGDWPIYSATGKLLRSRTIDASVVRFDHETEFLVVIYHEGSFHRAYDHTRGRLGARDIRPRLKETGLKK